VPDNLCIFLMPLGLPALYDEAMVSGMSLLPTLLSDVLHLVDGDEMDDTSASLWLIAYSSLGRLEFGHQG
jgi:hypothetical protein